MHGGEEDLPTAARAVGAVSGLAVVVWATWCTVVAFVGGTLPFLGWEMEGGIGDGLLWLFLIEPIVVTVAIWVTSLLVALVATVFGGRRRI